MIRLASILVMAAAPAVFAAPPSPAHDFPTTARVEYVVDCMRDNPGASRESLYKCSCAIDAIANKVDYDTYVELSTVANAITIAGERGGAVRDLKDSRKTAASFRDLQAGARKGCFLEK